MRNRTLKNLCFSVAAIVALLLPACSGTGGGGGGAGPRTFPRTPEGTRYLGGKLVLESVIPPSAQRPMATFVVRNVSDRALEGLTATILLYSPSRGGIQEYDSEAVERRFSVYKGEKVEIATRAANAGSVGGWELRIEAGKTVARSGGSAGSLFLKGTLECVGIQDDLTGMRPRIAFTVENVSAESQGQLEFMVILRKGGKTVLETSWSPVGGVLEPRQRIALEPDLSGADVGAAEAELQIRRMIF